LRGLSPSLRSRQAACTFRRSWGTVESHSMRAVVELILIVINLYWWVVIASAVMSWLVAFGVINTRNRFVASLGETLYRLTEPALRPIRNVMPDLGGVDISPVILLLLLWFIERLVILYLLPLAF
jgi:YggT family protein